MILLLILNILCFSLQGIALKQIRAATLCGNILSTACLTVMAGAPLWGYCVLSGTVISGETFLWGAAFGAMFALATSCYSYALKIGPLSYTTFFYTSSMLVPVFASIVIWKDPVTPFLVLGISLFLLSFYLIGVKGKEKQEGKKASVRWIVFCALSPLFSGLSTLSIKAHQMNMQGRESLALIGVGLTMAGGISLVLACIVSGKAVPHKLPAGIRQNLLPVFLAAAMTAVGNLLFGYLSSRVPGTYLYPLVSGGNLLLVTGVSLAVYHERISKSGLVGIVLGVLAIVFINQ